MTRLVSMTHSLLLVTKDKGPITLTLSTLRRLAAKIQPKLFIFLHGFPDLLYLFRVFFSTLFLTISLREAVKGLFHHGHESNFHLKF